MAKSRPSALRPAAAVAPALITAAAEQLFNDTFKPFASFDDFTIVYPNDQLKEIGKSKSIGEHWFDAYVAQSHPIPTDANSGEPVRVGEFRVALDFKSKGKPCDARIHACRSFDRKAWTLTVRWLPRPSGGPKAHTPAHSHLDELQWFAAKRWEAPDPVTDPGYLFGTQEVVASICEQWTGEAPFKGFMLVTGETGSQKSQVTRGLIYEYLKKLFEEVTIKSGANGRKPHVLTFEDPIEEWLRAPDADPSSKTVSLPDLHYLAPRRFDYTPRVLVKDVADLQTGLMKDALRQTPALVFAGELREVDQFRACLEFAGTGHLVVATAHAGSVVEAWSKLLTSVKAMTPGERAIYVSRVLMVLHLKKIAVPDTNYQAPPVIPAMWKQTPMGVQQLVADGLVSLLPTNPDFATPPTTPLPPDFKTTVDVACLGRSFFVKSMTAGWTDAKFTERKFSPDALMLAAFKDDLNVNG